MEFSDNPNELKGNDLILEVALTSDRYELASSGVADLPIDSTRPAS